MLNMHFPALSPPAFEPASLQLASLLSLELGCQQLRSLIRTDPVIGLHEMEPSIITLVSQGQLVSWRPDSRLFKRS